MAASDELPRQVNLGLQSEDAFARLRRASMDRNRKLVDIVDEVIHTGALPSTPRHPAGH